MGSSGKSKAALGAALGVLLAAPTGGMSMGMGAAYGAAAGGTVGSMEDTNKLQKAALSNLPIMPEVPKIEDMAGTAAAKAKSKRSAIARSRSIFTSPLGIAGEAEVAKKTLLGQ